MMSWLAAGAPQQVVTMIYLLSPAGLYAASAVRVICFPRRSTLCERVLLWLLQCIAIPADLTAITVGEACISLLEQLSGQLALNTSCPLRPSASRAAAGFVVPTEAAGDTFWSPSKEEGIPTGVMPGSPSCKHSHEHSPAPLVVEVLADASSMSPPTPRVLSAEQQPSFEQQQLVLGLLQSSLLPEVQRLLQQLQMLRGGDVDMYDAPLSRTSSGQTSSRGMQVSQSAEGNSKQVRD